ncbi:hypothetical protein MKEN_00173200 [Mycena kentingensis (nom. inval.)]|nr:hypothetical protein MKEN_00173200 [Mycena kentingensis (nom. inval.)]
MAMPYPLYRHPDNSTITSTTSLTSYPPQSISKATPFNPGPQDAPFNPPSLSDAPSYTSHVSYPTKSPRDLEERRTLARTPSPTPSEAKALGGGLFNWKDLMRWNFWFRKEWIKYYIILVIIVTVSALITIYHEQIVHWLTPVSVWLRDKLKFGWLVPIGVLFVISFPPLFGHEVVAVLCGLVWGLWVGFGIVAAGTFLGEVGNYYAFKYCCRARGEKMERTQIPYACLARCVRTGGFKIALIARFSAIPGHFTTAVFATCGMNIWVFSIAAILSLPKQFITVYLGVILEESDKGETSNQSKIISRSVLAATVLVTVLAMWWIFHQMNLVKPAVIYDRRKARQAKLERTGVPVDIYGNHSNESDASVNAGTDGRRNSLSDIPLTAKPTSQPQHPRYEWEQQQRQKQYEEYMAQRQREQQQQQQHQIWDAQGRAVGYTPGPPQQIMYAPQPHTPGRAPINPGAYQFSRSPPRADSGQPVGWDAAGSGLQMRERQGQVPQFTTSPPPQHYPTRQYTPTSVPEPATPTQAQYATSRPAPPGHEDGGPRSPFDDPPPASHLPASQAHSVEPTGMSYHTAYGSDGSDVGLVEHGYR